MQHQQVENLVTLAAEIARAQSPAKASTYDIPRVLIKLQKIASSLAKRYQEEGNESYPEFTSEARDNRQRNTLKLEMKGRQLCRSLGLEFEMARENMVFKFTISDIARGIWG